jgi:hypothetical protein
MKITNRIAAALGLALLLVASAFGQASQTSTTLSASVCAVGVAGCSSTDQTVTVASATGITGPGSLGQPTTVLYIDREEMKVTGAPNGTTIPVQRGSDSTPVTAHASGAVVWYGPQGYFAQGDPSGSCTSTLQLVLPVISVPTGNIWNCGNGQWTTDGIFTNRLTVGAQLTAAATLVFTNPIHHITSSATTVTTISAPFVPTTGGCVYLIPDAAMTGLSTSTGGNIALATTAVAKRLLTLCTDGAGKWYPSY